MGYNRNNYGYDCSLIQASFWLSERRTGSGEETICNKSTVR